MKLAFVDTLYFVALFNPRDQWQERAVAASMLVAETKLMSNAWHPTMKQNGPTTINC